MKNIKITVLLLCGMVLLPGCSLPDGNRGLAELPPAASAYTQRFDSDSGEALIDYNGRTYSFFGTIRNKMSNSSARECIGYLENDENTHLYTLSEDPLDNYIMMKNTTGFMEQATFYRATDTKQKDIFTPEYIESLGYECWGSSGIHYEEAEACIGIICEAPDIREILYTAESDGKFIAEGGTRYSNCKELKRGDLFMIEIIEERLKDKVDTSGPFNVTMQFKVITVDGEEKEVNGVFTHDMMLGGYLRGLEIRYDENSGYYLYLNY